jgi:hypothetical protein
MADFSLADLQGAFEGALKNTFGGNSGAKPSAGATATASAAGTSSLKEFYDRVTSVGTAAAPVISAFIGVGAHGKEMATVFGNITNIIPGVGQKLTGLVQAIEQGREQIAEAGKQGVGGNNVIEFAAQTKAAGMTMEGNLKLLKDMGPSLTGIGLNAQDANQRFLKLSQDTIESKLGQSLATAQGGVEGLNAAAAIMASNTKKNLREDADARKELAQASAELAREIDLASRATGKNRELIEAELKQRMKSPEAILAMNQMTDKQRVAFQMTEAALKTMGPSIGNLALQAASGSRMTQDNRDTFNALGPAGGELVRAIKMLQSAGDDKKLQEEAKAALTKAQAEVNRVMSSKEYAAQAQTGTTTVAAKQRQLITENEQRAGVQKTAQEMGGTFLEAQLKQAEIGQKQQAGLKGIGPGADEVDAGQTGIRLLNAGQENFRKLAVAGATELVKFNDEFGRSPKLIKGVADSIEFLSGKIGETSAQKNEKYIAPVGNTIKQYIDKATPPENSNTPEPGTVLGDTPPGQRIVPKREGGSKEATGNWFEDFGVGKIMELHKKEAVVPEAKLPEFMKDMMGQMQTATSGMASTMSQKGNPFEQITKQMQTATSGMASTMSQKGNPFEQITKQLQSVKMPQAPQNMLGQLEGQFKGLAAGMSNIKQPEFPKLPMLPKAPEVAPRKTEADKAAEVTARRQSDNPDTGNLQRKKMETAPEDIQTKILDALNQLNKTMGQMVAHTSDISETSSKTARYAGKAGSRTAA